VSFIRRPLGFHLKLTIICYQLGFGLEKSHSFMTRYLVVLHIPMFYPYTSLINFFLKEISYQTIGHGLSTDLSHAKNEMWPTFPIQCGVYVLDNYKHVGLEIEEI